MSWDIRLIDDNGDVCQVANHHEGDLVCVGGSTDAKMSVTFNYYSQFGDVLPCGFAEFFNGKRLADVGNTLLGAIDTLGVITDADYWKPTPGNAGHALAVLLEWAKQHPIARFEVSA